MTEIMTPSKTTTAGQIDKAVANYRALLEKHAGEFNAEAVQRVLGQSELAGEQFGVFRCRVEAVSNLIVRKVKVNRSRSPQETLDATGRVQYTEREVVDSMPKGEGDEVEVVFFKPDFLGGGISNENLREEFELRSLKPADPYTLSSLNEADPDFADETPHGTYWKNSNDDWCSITFHHWGLKRGVFVTKSVGDWTGDWWFAGIRK